MSKILVAYYSRTGITRKIAEKIKEKLNCDIEEIISVKNRSGPIGYIICGKEATQKTMAEIKEISKNPSDYDLVIVGTPVWAWNLSSPVRTYLENNKGKFKKISGFCTMGGDGDKQSFAEIEKICANKLISNLSLKTKEIITDNFTEKLDRFAEDIKNQLN